MDNIVGGRCSVSLITQLGRCIVSKNKYIFRHLKLEIALAIPASNDEKYNSNNSAGKGLMLGQRRRRWSTIKPAMCRWLVWAGIWLTTRQKTSPRPVSLYQFNNTPDQGSLVSIRKKFTFKWAELLFRQTMLCIHAIFSIPYVI